MERLIKFIVVVAIMHTHSLNAQTIPHESTAQKNKIVKCFPAAKESQNISSWRIAGIRQVETQEPAVLQLPLLSKANSIPENYYTNCFGFFCRKEWMVEKTTKLPIRFRLGSLEYVNRLEGK